MFVLSERVLLSVFLIPILSNSSRWWYEFTHLMSVIFKDLPFPRWMWKRLPSIVDFVNHREIFRPLLKGMPSSFIYFIVINSESLCHP